MTIQIYRIQGREGFLAMEQVPGDRERIVGRIDKAAGEAGWAVFLEGDTAPVREGITSGTAARLFLEGYFLGRDRERGGSMALGQMGDLAGAPVVGDVRTGADAQFVQPTQAVGLQEPNPGAPAEERIPDEKADALASDPATLTTENTSSDEPARPAAGIRPRNRG